MELNVLFVLLSFFACSTALEEHPKFHFPIPWFWADNPKCSKQNWSELNYKTERPLKWGDGITDQFYWKSPNYFYRGPPIKQRRVWWGLRNEHEIWPWTGICNINEKFDRWQWCTCIIISNWFVLSSRLCFRNRPWDTPPTEKLPPIKITYGAATISRHTQTRFLEGILHHPNKDIEAALLKLQYQIVFDDTTKPIKPNSAWLYTTGWANLIPKCSTMTCGYVRFFNRSQVRLEH